MAKKISAKMGNLVSGTINSTINEGANVGILNFQNKHIETSANIHSNEVDFALSANSLEQADEKREFAMKNLAITHGSILLVVAALFLITLAVWACLARQVTNYKNKINKLRARAASRPRVTYHQNYVPSNFQAAYFPPRYNDIYLPQTMYSPSSGLPTQNNHFS